MRGSTPARNPPGGSRPPRRGRGPGAPKKGVTTRAKKPPGLPPPAAARAPATQPAKPDKWDVNAPPGMTTRQIPIDVDNGTWMNVDVSPDGRTIAFDLL